jgi:hypothetical protein
LKVSKMIVKAEVVIGDSTKAQVQASREMNNILTQHGLNRYPCSY